jgi:hypothetical protein
MSGCLVNSGYMRIGQFKSGYMRIGQVRSGYFRIVWLFHVSLG